MPERIQLRRTKGWRKPEGAIVVARPSKWGNPHRIVRIHGGFVVESPNGFSVGTFDHAGAQSFAVAVFRQQLLHRLVDEPDYLEPLRGHDLACWCPLVVPCHVDVLLELANQ